MTVYVITGPPAAGKSAWVREHAQPGRDITIDYDTLANALTAQPADNHSHGQHTHELTLTVRRTAIQGALKLATMLPINVFIIDSYLSPTAVAQYEEIGATLLTLDPGKTVVMDRCRETNRPNHAITAAERWYQR
ncbi:hypothetical protein BST33_10040 [Mycolicibacter minnesotensis]|uniref:Uncharacterized protein n=1 Tax=Mycolicibacter minnesotensis TaxID=1118379 RepID=A0A7I7R5A6_9MYCO|nr:AAA family ATPase [Mycolicibacter minnesotensis]ORB01099.1 hypothetical protein BST33_10040 [Mycolicibacter minnesotensis]BBY33357.1 hypothetical protein MMIN_14180 [Mycolicibacter minnesotensis]